MSIPSDPLGRIRKSLISLRGNVVRGEREVAERQIAVIGEFFRECKADESELDVERLLVDFHNLQRLFERIYGGAAAGGGGSISDSESDDAPVSQPLDIEKFTSSLDETSFQGISEEKPHKTRMLHDDKARELGEIAAEAPVESLETLFHAINSVRPPSGALPEGIHTLLMPPVHLDGENQGRTEQLSLAYDGVLPVRGDGDCLLRAVFTSLIAQGKSEKLMTHLPGLRDCSTEQLEGMFENPLDSFDEEICDALRIAIAEHIRENKDDYPLASENLKDVLQRQAYLGEAHILALSRVLGITIDVVNKDGSSAVRYSTGDETSVPILYYDNHFDVLIPRTEGPALDFPAFEEAVKKVQNESLDEATRTRALQKAFSLLNSMRPKKGPYNSYDQNGYRTSFLMLEEEKRRLGISDERIVSGVVDRPYKKRTFTLPGAVSMEGAAMRYAATPASREDILATLLIYASAPPFPSFRDSIRKAQTMLFREIAKREPREGENVGELVRAAFDRIGGRSLFTQRDIGSLIREL